MLQIKLLQTGSNGVTRKLTFPHLPLWPVLATRIETLYAIPSQDVGLSYIDSDGDEVTISSQEELQDYHLTLSTTSFDFMKFTVKDLSVSGARRPPSDVDSSGNICPPPVGLRSSTVTIPPRRPFTFLSDRVSPRLSGVIAGAHVQDENANVQLPQPTYRPMSFVSMRSPSHSPSSSRSGSPVSFLGPPVRIHVRGRSMSTSPSQTPRMPLRRSHSPSSSRSRSHSPLPQSTYPSVFGPRIPRPHSPGLFGPRSPEPQSPDIFDPSNDMFNYIIASPPTVAVKPPISQRHSVDSLIIDMLGRKHDNPHSGESNNNMLASIPLLRPRSPPHPHNGHSLGYVAGRVLPPRSASPSPPGLPEPGFMQQKMRSGPTPLDQDQITPFETPQCLEPSPAVHASGAVTADKIAISNLDITNLTNVILGEVREAMAVEMWQSVRTRLEDEKEKLLISVRMEMASARDELCNLNDDLDAANEQLRTLGGINAAREEVAQARQEIQQAREEIARAREACSRTPDWIKNEWAEIKASCEEIKKAWRELESSREEAAERAHHPPFHHLPPWMTPFPGPPPPPPPPSGLPHHRGPPPFPHRPPFHMPPPPPPPPHPYFPPPPPHHHSGMEALRNEPPENDGATLGHKQHELRRRSTFPARLGPPREPEVLHAKFSDGGLRFGITRNGTDLAHFPRLNRNSDEVTRREELEEAKRVYKDKKAMWRREREEARKANRDVRASMRVRPFDMMTLPQPVPPPARSSLRPHVEESSSEEETRPLPPRPDAPPHFTPQQASLRASLLLSLASMGFTHESHPYLERVVQREIERTDAEQLNSERMMQNILEELLRN